MAAPSGWEARRDGEGDGEDAHASGEKVPPGAVPVVHPIDLAALRARLPENLYWRLGAPTDDPATLARRAEEQARHDALFGKVQSGSASEEEIHTYYDHRRRLSEDYVAFARLVLTEYGEELPDTDLAPFALSIRMHEARLAELPRQIDEALARKGAADRRRAAWRAQQRGG